MTKVNNRVRMLTIAAVGLLALGSTGCSAAASPDSPHASETAEAIVSAGTPTQTPPAEPDLQDLPDGTLIATGDLTGRDSPATGHVEIRATGSRTLDIRFLGLSVANGPDVTFAMSSLPATSKTASFTDPVVNAFEYYAYDAIEPSGDQDVRTPGPGYGSNATSDPTWMKSMLLFAPGRFGTLLAVAPLTWTFPTVRPQLKVIDSGASTGALGTVRSVEGIPAFYTVAAGDTLDQVVARFGISIDDLTWLNPRYWRSLSLRSDEVLNLSRSFRGLRMLP